MIMTKPSRKEANEEICFLCAKGKGKLVFCVPTTNSIHLWQRFSPPHLERRQEVESSERGGFQKAEKIFVTVWIR